jgi:hypothetical protein
VENVKTQHNNCNDCAKHSLKVGKSDNHSWSLCESVYVIVINARLFVRATQFSHCGKHSLRGLQIASAQANSVTSTMAASCHHLGLRAHLPLTPVVSINLTTSKVLKLARDFDGLCTRRCDCLGFRQSQCVADGGKVHSE